MTILFGGDLGMAPRILASRRFRDLMRGHEEEFGNLTVGDQSLIRTAALLALKCEEMQSAVVRGESPAKAYRTYELTFANGKPIFTLSEASRIMEKAFEEIFGPNTIE